MISHKHKCIFIHIPKTAGMSIENSFLQSLGLKFHKGQCPPLLLSYNENKNIGPPSLAHLTPAQYVAHSYISQELFESYFKFTFVRNPWERAVSIYKYFSYHRMLSFEGFLEYRFPELWEERYDFVMPQVNFIFDQEGNQLVDYVGRFENLKGDFSKIQENLAHSVVELAHINKPPLAHNWYSRWNMKFLYRELKERPHLIKHLYLSSPVKTHYTNYYTPLAKELVLKYYKEDIERLEYKF